jgi:hypothetical protein
MMSSYLADQVRDTVREAVASRSVEHIVNGSAAAGSLVDEPTLHGCDEFVYDIDLSRKPSGAYKTALAAGLVDPFRLVAGDMKTLSDGCKELLGADHPVLTAAAQYFFNIDGGKKIRPVMVSVCLCSRLVFTYTCTAATAKL